MTPRKKKNEKKENSPVPPSPEPAKRKKSPEKGEEPLFIVGIGGSAGALEAFDHFFPHVPPDSGLAFVVVTHLDPTQKGIMPELLQRLTAMKVHQAQDNMKVLANSVYVIPPNKDLAILNGTLQLMEPSAPRGLRLPIDFFFRHLAEDQKERSIGIILSGMGSDGTLGLRAIKEQNGMAMVQDPATAKYDGMPRSVLETGLADITGAVEKLPGRLLDYTRHFYKLSTQPQLEKKFLSAFQKILIILRARTGNDFSLYKKSTILRRIDRRMSLHQITNLAHYVGYLQENPPEVDLLFKEMLIGVTNFFRDREAFDLLKERVLRPLLRRKAAHEILRVWVPGCSTGEEAYSLAILLRECLDEEPTVNLKVQIYGTDLDQAAINFARQGLYPGNITADVDAERLKRFFLPEDHHYRIRKSIREMIIFAPQNITTDPPFTKLDLLSCRNLLIYLNPEVQKRIMPLFFYALNSGGCLFLGPSETVGGFSDLFTPEDTKWKIYRRREARSATLTLPEFPTSFKDWTPIEKQKTPVPLAQQVENFIVENIAPSAVVINEKGEILYTTQRTGRFLEPAVGRPSSNIFEMAREGLKLELSVGARKAYSKNGEVEIREVPVQSNGKKLWVNVRILPFPGSPDQPKQLMVLFEEAEDAEKADRQMGRRKHDQVNRAQELEQELKFARENLQTTIEEMDTSQEELKSTNEELQSTNEELQSTNEELNTSKEELQSLNEELMTLNSELQSKNDELSLANSDLRNLLNSTQIATIFLDNRLNIKRFTNQATALFNLISTDIGRPLTHIVSKLQYENLEKDIHDVLDTLVFKEIQVPTRDGRRYTMRIMPYRTLENIIDGVVITFNDISGLKELEGLLVEKERWRLMAQEIRRAADALILQDPEGRILAWNKGAERLYGWKETSMRGRSLRDFIPPAKQKEYDALLERIKRGEEKVEPRETLRVNQSGKTLPVWSAISQMTDEKGRLTAVATIEKDMTLWKQLETSGSEIRTCLEMLLDRLPLMVAAFDDDGSVLYWNPECERQTGWSAKELVDHPEPWARLHPGPEPPRPPARPVDPELDPPPWTDSLTCRDGSVKTIRWKPLPTDCRFPGWEGLMVGSAGNGEAPNPGRVTGNRGKK